MWGLTHFVLTYSSKKIYIVFELASSNGQFYNKCPRQHAETETTSREYDNNDLCFAKVQKACSLKNVIFFSFLKTNLCYHLKTLMIFPKIKTWPNSSTH